jgi:hypothetical protein
MFRYGFELEGFALGTGTEIVIPPIGWPTDGFPGLVEIRTTGPNLLEDAYFGILKGLYGIRDNICNLSIIHHEHKFSGKQVAEMRRTRRFDAKDQLDIRCIYNKEPRALNGRTLASFQINISNLINEEYKTNRVVDGKIEEQIRTPEKYGMLDVPNIVRRLDEAFKDDIKRSNRQPGFYAIKDTYRLEYRSLPNFVFPANFMEARPFLEKIRKAVEG